MRLRLRHLYGDVIEEDVSCNSTYIATIKRVSIALHRSYHWVDISTEILYLLLDNGGHGTNETVNEYVLILKNEYNVHCIRQISRSPFTNALDLGV